MKQMASISAMLKFQFGTRILCSDGDEGFITSVGFDAATQHMTYIGVRQGRFFGKTGYLPFQTVNDATNDVVTLNISRADLEAAPKEMPAATFFDTKTSVESDGAQGARGRGSVLLIAVQPGSGMLSYIVAHHFRPNQDTLLRQEYVTKLEQGRIVVAIPEATLQTLPAYRSDRDLQQEVESALFDQTQLHVDFKGMNVRVLDSILYLRGNISSSLRSDVVQDQASGVPGILEIKNELIGDDELAADLAVALGKDQRTRDLPIGVYPKLGVVRLSGAVHTAQQKAAAEEVVRNFPGVRGLSDTLVVNEKEDLLRVMAPTEGGEAEDLIPGRYVRHTK